MAKPKPFEYIIEFEPDCLVNNKNEVCFKSKSVQELVRCRDCEHGRKQVEDDGYVIYCPMWDRWEMPPNGFCHYGKKA